MYHPNDPFSFAGGTRHLFEDQLDRFKLIEPIHQSGHFKMGVACFLAGTNIVINPAVKEVYKSEKLNQGIPDTVINDHLIAIESGKYRAFTTGPDSPVICSRYHDSGYSDFIASFNNMFTKVDLTQKWHRYGVKWTHNGTFFDHSSALNRSRFQSYVTAVMYELGLSRYMQFVDWDFEVVNTGGNATELSVHSRYVFSIVSGAMGNNATASLDRCFVARFPIPKEVGKLRTLSLSRSPRADSPGQMAYRTVDHSALSGLVVGVDTAGNATPYLNSNTNSSYVNDVDFPPLVHDGKSVEDFRSSHFLLRGYNETSDIMDTWDVNSRFNLWAGSECGFMLNVHPALIDFAISVNPLDLEQSHDYDYEVYKAEITSVAGKISSKTYADTYRALLDKEYVSGTDRDKVETELAKLEANDSYRIIGRMYSKPIFYPQDVVTGLKLYGLASDAGMSLMDQIYQKKDDSDSNSTDVKFKDVKNRIASRAKKETKFYLACRLEDTDAALYFEDPEWFQAMRKYSVQWFKSESSDQPQARVTHVNRPITVDMARVLIRMGTPVVYDSSVSEMEVLSLLQIADMSEIYDSQFLDAYDTDEIQEDANFNPISLADSSGHPVIPDVTTDVGRRSVIAFKFPKDIEKSEYVMSQYLNFGNL